MKRLWHVTVERTLTAKVLAWAETAEEAQSEVQRNSPLDKPGWLAESTDEAWPQPAVAPGGLIMSHDLGNDDDVYGSQDGQELTVAEAIAIETGNISALPEHLAPLALNRKEANNGQLPLIL